jgi:MFS family permease
MQIFFTKESCLLPFCSRNGHNILFATIMDLPPKHFQRFAICALFFLLGLNFASWASRIPDVRNALQLNDAQLGLALLASPMGNLPGVVLAGFLVARLGSRAVVCIALPACSAVLIFLGCASSFGYLFLFLFFLGLLSSVYDNGLNTQAVAIEKIYRRSIMSSFHGMWSLGGVAGSILGGIMAALGVRPAAHFGSILLLAIGAFIFLYHWMLPRESAKKSSEKEIVVKNSRSSGKQLILLGIVAFCSMATEGAMYNWSSVYFQTVLHASTALTRLGYVCCMIAMVTGRFSADHFITRYGATAVLCVSGCFISLGFLVTWQVEGIPLTTVGFSMIGLGMAAGVPISFSLAGKLPNISPSIAIATVVAISFWGFMITPPLIGFLSHMFHLRAALALMGILGICITALSVTLKGNGPQNFAKN